MVGELRFWPFTGYPMHTDYCSVSLGLRTNQPHLKCTDKGHTAKTILWVHHALRCACLFHSQLATPRQEDCPTLLTACINAQPALPRIFRTHLIKNQECSDLAYSPLHRDQTDEVGVQLIEDVPHALLEHKLLDSAHLLRRGEKF